MVYLSPGVAHIHSLYSDGTSSIEEIAFEAKKAGLEWIIITDHNTLDGLNNHEEGWYNGLAVLIGEEVSPDLNHYLALDIETPISSNLAPEEFVKEVKKQGGFGFIAHPDESETRKNNYHTLSWSDYSLRNFGGIEIWNFLSNWVDEYDPKDAIKCFLWKNHILSGPTKRVLNWWDELNHEKPDEVVPAIGGSDAHALNHKIWKFSLKIFPYYDSFCSITNFLNLDQGLSNDFEVAKAQIYSALKDGNNTIINRHWGCKDGNFEFYIDGKNRAYSGGIGQADDSTGIVVRLPTKATIRLISNGELIREVVSKELLYKNVQPGKYRVEVYYKNHPWIFTNPVIVK